MFSRFLDASINLLRKVGPNLSKHLIHRDDAPSKGEDPFTLEMGMEDGENTLETSGEDGKSTLEIC